jgi:hypothetical protein
MTDNPGCPTCLWLPQSVRFAEQLAFLNVVNAAREQAMTPPHDEAT